MTTFFNQKIQYNRLSSRSLIQKLLDGTENDSDIFKTEQSNHMDIHVLDTSKFTNYIYHVAIFLVSSYVR